MDGEPPLSGLLPPIVPDSQVPAERVETVTSARRKTRRASRFLKGPILLSWVREYIGNPADRLLLVLRAHSDMNRSRELRVTADILRDANVMDRKMAYRAVTALEARGALEEVVRKKGLRPVVRLRPPSVAS